MSAPLIRRRTHASPSLLRGVLLCVTVILVFFMPQKPGTALATWTDLDSEARRVLSEAHSALTTAQEHLQKVTNPEKMSEEDEQNMGASMLSLISAERGYKEAEELLKQTKKSLAAELKQIRKVVKKAKDEQAAAQLAQLDEYVAQLESQIKAVREQTKAIDTILAPLKKVRMK